MLIKKQDLNAALREVRNVRETLDAYCLAPGKIPVSMDDLIHCVEEQYGISVTVNTVPLDSNDRLRGAVELYEDRATIYVDSNLNLLWTRYVCTKELGHIIVENADNLTEDPTNIIEFMMLDDLGQGNNNAAPPDTASEWLAKMAAWELLFPHDLREASKNQMDAGETSLFQLSEQFQIPEHVVEQCLGGYMEMIGEMWNEIG